MKRTALLRVACGGSPSTTSPTPRAPTDARVSVNAPDTRLTSDSVLAAITSSVVVAKISGAYMGGIKRCYKKQLVNDATLRGTIR